MGSKKQDTIPMGKAIAIILAVILGITGLIGGTFFFALSGGNNSINANLGNNNISSQVVQVGTIKSYVMRYNNALDSLTEFVSPDVDISLAELWAEQFQHFVNSESLDAMRIRGDLQIVEGSIMPQYEYSWDNDILSATIQILEDGNNEVALVRVGGTFNNADSILEAAFAPTVAMGAIAMIDPTVYSHFDLINTLMSILDKLNETVVVNGVAYQFAAEGDGDFVFLALRDSRLDGDSLDFEVDIVPDNDDIAIGINRIIDVLNIAVTGDSFTASQVKIEEIRHTIDGDAVIVSIVIQDVLGNRTRDYFFAYNTINTQIMSTMPIGGDNDPDFVKNAWQNSIVYSRTIPDVEDFNRINWQGESVIEGSLPTLGQVIEALSP